jgi:4-hydroxy-tetrahydrodipicolinate reductase
MDLSVCVAGATGWTGRPVAQAVIAADDLPLTSSVSRSAAGRDLGEAWGLDRNGVPVLGSVIEALQAVDRTDVMVDFTSPEAVLANALTAVERGVFVVIGASGIGAAELERVGVAPAPAGVGVVAAGNFSVTAAMAQAAALLVARHLPSREIIDYASAAKPDAPSGTARELAERLGEVSRPTLEVPLQRTSARLQARGTTIAGTQVHSVRLPSFVVCTEVVFAQPDERLVIRHDAGGTPTPYVSGALLAIRAVGQVRGLVRGLDALLLGQGRPS